MALVPNTFFGWNIITVIIFTSIIIMVYSMLGGIQAVVWTDAIQAIILILGAVVCLVLIIFKMHDGLDGIIATNTTIGRDGIPDRYRDLKGGLSGAPLRDRSTAVIRYIAQRTQGHLPIVGAGGIANAQDAIEKLEAGATLLQIYTGLIYAGPNLVKQINRALPNRA